MANTIDLTFANGGSVTLPFTAEAVAVAPDGRLLAVGLLSGSPAGGNEAAIERFLSNGTPDTTFGGTGIVTDAVSTDEAFYGVTVQSDGKVIASGTSNGKFLLVRYNVDGSLDTTFGTGGRVTTTLTGSTGIAYGVALEPDGGVDVGGNAGAQASAFGYTSAGAPDPGFHNGTPAQFTAGGATSTAGDILGQIRVQSDGKIVGVGATGDEIFVIRLNADGSLDTSFDAGGPTPGVRVMDNLAASPLNSTTPDFTEGLAIDSSGDILVANHTVSGHFGTVRIKPDGTIDTTFGASGTATTVIGAGDDVDVVTVQSDGRILVAGTTTTAGATQTALAVYASAGALDPTFGNAGTEVFDTGLPAAVASSVGASESRAGSAAPDALGLGEIIQRIMGAMQSDGKLVLAASQATGTVNTSSLRRLVLTPSVGTPTPTPIPSPLPTGSLGAAVTSTVPASVVTSTPLKSKVSVTVTAPASAAASGTVTIKVYVSQAKSLTGATQAATLTRKVRIRAGRSRKFVVKLSAIPTVPAGTYFLLATVSAPDGTTTGVAAPAQVTIAPAAVRIAGSDLAPPAAASAGRKAAATLTLQNTGNVTAAGTVNVTLTATGSAAGSAAQALGTVPVKVRLKPSATRTFKVRFTVPTGLAAGSYALSAALDVAALGSNATSAGNVTAATPLVVS